MTWRTCDDIPHWSGYTCQDDFVQLFVRSCLRKLENGSAGWAYPMTNQLWCCHVTLSHHPPVCLQEYPEGALVYPVDLVSFEPQHGPAVHRMLGHSLIALNDRVAAEVVNR